MDGAAPSAPGARSAQDCAAPPRLPVNWYMLAGAREVKPGRLVTRRLMGRDYVLFRTRGGELRAFAAHCAHMGCHLMHARVVAGGLRCALHHRLIGLDGHFLGPDGTPSEALVQASLPVREHLGGVFVWLGPEGKETDLPLPAIAADGPVMARYVGRFEFEANWYSLMANGFDMEHLAAVHRRALREEVEIDESVPGRFRIGYLTRVIGTKLSDRVMKALSGDHIRASMTAVGGSIMLVESQVARPSFFLLSMGARPDGGTTVHALVGAGGDARRPLDALRLRATDWLFRRFFEADFAVFEGLDWHPPEPALNKTDEYAQRLYRYFCAQSEADDG